MARKTPRRTKRPRTTRAPQRRSSRDRKRFTTIGGRTLYASPERYPRLYEWIISVGDST